MRLGLLAAAAGDPRAAALISCSYSRLGRKPQLWRHLDSSELLFIYKYSLYIR